MADGVHAVIPGHQRGVDPHDPRVGPKAPLEWLRDVDDWQREQLVHPREEA